MFNTGVHEITSRITLTNVRIDRAHKYNVNDYVCIDDDCDDLYCAMRIDALTFRIVVFNDDVTHIVAYPTYTIIDINNDVAHDVLCTNDLTHADALDDAMTRDRYERMRGRMCMS